MENASKAIWLAVGAILFIVALTITIIMYTNMINTVNNTISINNIKTNVTEQEGQVQEIQYTKSQLYFILKGVYENFENDRETDIYTANLSVKSTLITKTNYIEKLSNLMDNLPAATYTVTYTYERVDSGMNNMNNHKIASINW